MQNPAFCSGLKHSCRTVQKTMWSAWQRYKVNQIESSRKSLGGDFEPWKTETLTTTKGFSFENAGI